MEKVDILLKINSQIGQQFKDLLKSQTGAASGVFQKIKSVDPKTGKPRFTSATDAAEFQKALDDFNKIRRTTTLYKRLIEDVFGEEIAMRKANIDKMKVAMNQQFRDLGRVLSSGARAGIAGSNPYLDEINSRRSSLQKRIDRSSGSKTHTTSILKEAKEIDILVQKYKVMTERHRAAQMELRDMQREFRTTRIEVLGLRGAVTDMNSGWVRFRHMGVWRLLSSVRNTLLLVSFATAAWAANINRAITSSKNYEKAMLGVITVGSKTGSNIRDINMAVKELSSDGLMDVTDIATGLKNLMASGFNLEQAMQISKAFKDIGVFNRQASLTLGEAFTSATEGIKNNNSILVDNIGLTKNLSIIMKEAGLSVDDLGRISSDAAVRQKFFNGIMKEAALFAGDAERALGTYEGVQSRLNAQNEKTRRTLGQMLLPIMKEFNLILIQISNSLQQAFNADRNQIINNMRDAIKILGAGLNGIVNILIKINELSSKFSDITGTSATSGILGGLGLLFARQVGFSPLKQATSKIASIELERRKLQKFIAEESRPGGGLEVLPGGGVLNPKTAKDVKKRLQEVEKLYSDFLDSQRGVGKRFAESAKMDMQRYSDSTVMALTKVKFSVKALGTSFKMMGALARIAFITIGTAVKTLLFEILPLLLVVTAASAIYGKITEGRRKEEEAIQAQIDANENYKNSIMETISEEIQNKKQLVENLKIQDNINDTFEERIRLLKEIRNLQAIQNAAQGHAFDKQNIMNNVKESLRVTLTESGLFVGGKHITGLSTPEEVQKALDEVAFMWSYYSENIFNKKVNETFGGEEQLLKYSNALLIMRNSLEKMLETMNQSVGPTKNFEDFLKELENMDKVKKEFSKISDEVLMSGLTGLSKDRAQTIKEVNDFFFDIADEIKSNMQGGPFSPEDIEEFDAALERVKNKMINMRMEAKKLSVITDLNLRLSDLNDELSMVGSSEIDKTIMNLRKEFARMVGEDYMDEFENIFNRIIAVTEKINSETKNFELRKAISDLNDEIERSRGNAIMKEYFENIKQGANSALSASLAIKQLNQQIVDQRNNIFELTNSTINRGNTDFFTLRPAKEIKEATEKRRVIIGQMANIQKQIENIKALGIPNVFKVQLIADAVDQYGSLEIALENVDRLLKRLEIEDAFSISSTLKESVGTILTSAGNVEDYLVEMFINIPEQVKSAQAEANQALINGEMTYAEHQKRMTDIDRQATQARIANYIAYADAVVVQTARMIAMAIQRYYVEMAVENIFSKGAAGTFLGAAAGAMGIGLLLGGLGLLSTAVGRNNAANFSFGDSTTGSTAEANRRATAGIQAPIQNLTIIPTLTINAEHDIYIGSGSVEEFSYIWGERTKEIVNDAVQTGEIRLNK